MDSATQHDNSLAESHSLEQMQPAESVSTSELECPVCSDLLFNPVVAPCGHDMCKNCYQKWCQASHGCAVCPICRAPLPGTLGVCLRLKRIVEELHPQLSKRRRLDHAGSDEASTCKAVPAPHGNMAGNPWMAYQQLYSQFYWGGYAATAPQAQEYSAASDAAIGTPVMDYVQRWRMQAMSAAQLSNPTWAQGAAVPAARVIAAGARAITPCVASQSSDAQLHAHQPRWQSVADVPMRLQCAREILVLFCARSAALTGHSNNRQAPAHTPPFTQATLAAVRAVEVHLYRTALSREAYMERATLPTRVAQYVRGRASVLAAARQERHTGVNQQEVDQPLPVAATTSINCTKV